MKKYRKVVQTDIAALVAEYGGNNIDDSSVNGEDDDKIQCLCPYCIEAGEPNMKRTLNVYLSSLSFWCFRCRVLGFDSSIKFKSVEHRSAMYQKYLSSMLNPIASKEFQEINIDHLKDITDLKYIDYFINDRSYKYVPHVDNWKFKQIKFLGRDGILLPFIYDNKIINYQIRYLSSKKKMKYYLNESDKIPFFVNGYDSNKRYDKITLVEGVFDSTAAYLFNLPNPIAVLGSSITELVFSIIIKLLKPTEIILAFDDMNINAKIHSQLSDRYLCKYSYIDTKGDDLDEYLRDGRSPSVELYTDDKLIINDTMSIYKYLKQNNLR